VVYPQNKKLIVFFLCEQRIIKPPAKKKLLFCALLCVLCRRIQKGNIQQKYPHKKIKSRGREI
jgi:hypothetical protein